MGGGGSKKEIIDAGTHNVHSRPTGTLLFHTKAKDPAAIKSASMVFTGKEFFGDNLKWEDMEIQEKIGG